MKITQALKQLKKEYLATQPSELLREHGWDALEARIKEEQAPGLMRLWYVAKKPLFLIASVVLVVILGGTGTVYAAQWAKPGDRLYPVKIASERIAAQIAPEQWKDEVAGAILHRRVSEAQEAVDTKEEMRVKHAQEEYVRTVDSLRIAGALRSETATKAAENAKESIEAMTKRRQEDKEKPSKPPKERGKEENPPSPTGNVKILQQMRVPSGDEKKVNEHDLIPSIPTIGL